MCAEGVSGRGVVANGDWIAPERRSGSFTWPGRAFSPPGPLQHPWDPQACGTLQGGEQRLRLEGVGPGIYVVLPYLNLHGNPVFGRNFVEQDRIPQ